MTERPDDASQVLDERSAAVGAREAAVDEREEDLDAREARMAIKADGTEALLRDAERRDDLAEMRDAAALHRDAGAAINDFFSHKRPDIGTLRARGAAALDRTDARGDRAASKKDRSHLTEEEQSEGGGEG